MTGREQTRRDARKCAADLTQSQEDIARTTADVVDLLLAELEQAERRIRENQKGHAGLRHDLEQAEEKGKKAYDWAMHQRDLGDSLAAQYKAELEQAERERDEAIKQKNAAMILANNGFAEFEARLAKVPALVEALRYIQGDDVAGMDGHLRPENVARDALADWEQE